MVEPTKEKEGTTPTKGKTGKRKWLGRIGTFLLMGGVDTGLNCWRGNSYRYFGFG